MTAVFASGQQISSSLAGTEMVAIDNGGAVRVAASINTIKSFAATTVASFTTSAMTNSTSLTLSSQFTALTFTQTSTGNTVHLPASPTNGQINGFSITNDVTNLTVSSAANTVLNGAATGTTSAGATLWWIYNSSNTSWYKYNGTVLSQ